MKRPIHDVQGRLCGCCEGTQQLTPKPIANRPGLDALAYRMGTQAAFLETMKARLSDFYLEIQQDDLDAEGKPKTTRVYPLRGLTTRAAEDPSIALLDAWATLADVLTFYQERIANEGYLRTATERRSILELARLVGYALRPGVASTVYLAYTLDDNAKEPVVIPVGARAQSVPGPGELPQSFETVEKLEARAAWNLLKPRMTRPQTANTIRDSNPHPRVYLKGISTGLKPNDPLLLDFGDGAQPELYRVMDVKPDAAADRTRVSLQEWYVPAKSERDMGSPEAIAAETIRQLNVIVERYLGEEADRIELSRDTQMFGRVSGVLGSLQQRLAEDIPFPAMFAHLKTETLSNLELERRTAEKYHYTDLQPWLESMIAELSGVAERASVERAEALAREFAIAEIPGNGGARGRAVGVVPDDKFKHVFPGLVKPPSVPPRNALILERRIDTAFQPKADAHFQVVGAFRADVRESLPAVVANTKVTRDVAIKVYALRVKAAPFGHNALSTEARFRAEPSSGWAPLTVQFTNQSTGLIASYEWDFGDGSNSNQQSPSHSYVKSGEYTARLAVQGATGAAQAQMIIHVWALVAQFDAKPTSAGSLTVQFTDESTPPSTSYAYTWDFGDNTGSNQQNPIHTFPKEGEYTVKLTVSDGTRTDQAVKGIWVGPLINVVAPPEAGAPSPSTVQPQVAVTSPVETTPHTQHIIFLDAEYNISPQSWIAVLRRTDPPQSPVIWLDAGSVTHESLAAYGLSGKTTRLDLGASKWFDGNLTMDVVRSTTIYAQSEELALAEEPIDNPICGSDDASDPDAYIELDGVYSELQAGRWLIVSGERTDIETLDPDNPDKTVSVPGVQSSELVMLSEVVQRVAEADQVSQAGGYHGYEPEPVRGEKIHTYIRFDNKLQYCYKRDAVKIYGNVVKATHGETRNEVLGSGDGSKAFQSFVLKQPPLTYVAAPTPAGAESTLLVRVNDVEWHEEDSLADLGPTDRSFITRTDDYSKTTVFFGNGKQGARPPTGVENIKAVYRNGIGKPGNVRAEQISLLVTRPLDVKEVINPMRASGGADKESRDQARKHAPLAVLALDRLVSTQDYADFARTFAGIGKASASRLTDGRHQLVHVTIAGADDIPIEKSSDLYQNLVKALRKSGDPYLPIMVEIRELMLIVLSANIRILPDYQWESVVTKIRASLLDTFSFERQELGQDVLLSEIIRTIQSVEGVAYVDVDMIGGVSEKDEAGEIRTPDEIAEEVQQMIENQKETPEPRIQVKMARVEDGTIHPAQLAFLTPDVEATLILNEVRS